MACFLSKQRRGIFILLCMIVSSFITIQSYGSIPNNLENSILIINSYTESSPWSSIYINDVYKALQGQEQQYSVFTEHMNMLMVRNEDDLDELRTHLFEKYNGMVPRIIVLLGSSPWVLLGDEIRKKWDNVPILLCVEEGFVGPKENYLSKKSVSDADKISLEELAKEPQLTVLYVPSYIKETISLMKQMTPAINRVLFLTDQRYISAQYRSQMDQVIQTYFPELKVEHLLSGVITTDSLVKRLETVGPETGILFYSWFQQNIQGGNVILLTNIHRILDSYTKRPIYTLADIGVADQGLIGGYFHSADEIREMTIEAVRNILAGKDVAHTFISKKATPVINYATLLNKGFTIESVPEDTFFYMKPLTFWDMYKYYIILTTFVLLFLLIYKYRNEQHRLKLMTNYRNLFTNMPVAYLKLDLIRDDSGKITDSKIVEVNPSFQALFNARPDVMGKKISELVIGDLNQMRDFIRNINEHDQRMTFQYYIKETDKHLNIILSSSEDGDVFEIFCVDNTQLAKLQQTLHNVNHKLAMSLDVANLVPWKWDLKKQVILCDVNRSVKLSSLDNLMDEEQLSVPDHLYFAKICKDDRARVQQSYQDLIDGTVNKVKEEYRILVNDGKYSRFDWVEAQAIVEDREPDGTVVSLIGSSQIITHRKKMQDDLMQAKVKAEESNRLKSAFLANMSHEIRTPLNAIVGFSGILASADEEEEKQEYLNIIENNNTLLLQLIGDILDLSKIEAGTLEYVYSDVDLNVLLKELEQSSRLRVKNDSVHVVFDDRITDAWINTDKNRLLQVVGNLITNAIKFTEQGQISFGYTLEENNRLYFYVADTGCGIPDDKVDSVFGRFVKLNHFAQGTGLGLSICKTIVEQMGGEIGLESRLGEGTRFWFTLPYKKGSPKKEEIQQEIIPERIEKSQLTVLVAEDNPGNYKLFESILSREYQVIHAWNGEEAVRLYEEYSPHIILMDINMPIVDGYEATRQIRERSATVPIIAVTAYAFSTDEQRIINNGFDAYTAKPINAEKLKNQMKGLLQRRLIFI